MRTITFTRIEAGWNISDETTCAGVSGVCSLKFILDQLSEQASLVVEDMLTIDNDGFRQIEMPARVRSVTIEVDAGIRPAAAFTKYGSSGDRQKIDLVPLDPAIGVAL